MDKNDLRTTLVGAGLSWLLKDIDQIAQESIRLGALPVQEGVLPVGVSKLGGQPDLPPNVVWPQWKGLAQSFLAQINFADVQPYDAHHYFPSQGMLWFFYDALQETYGDNPSDRGGWSVIFHTDLTSLQRVSFPPSLPASSRFQPCSLSFSAEITLSQHPELEINGFDWTNEEQEQYERFLATFPDEADRAAIHHRMLGFPDAIQDDMRLQCQLIAHGITDETDPRAVALRSGAHEWQLLLQIDSDEHAGMLWANTGMLYFWLPVSELLAHHFAATWLVLQSE